MKGYLLYIAPNNAGFWNRKDLRGENANENRFKQYNGADEDILGSGHMYYGRIARSTA